MACRRPAEVEAYFERLDAAFAALQTRTPPAAAPASGSDPGSDPVTPASAPVPPAAPSLVAEAFMALLALEEGEPGARPLRLVTGQVELRLTDAVIEELRRLIREELARIRNENA